MSMYKGYMMKEHNVNGIFSQVVEHAMFIITVSD